MNYIPNDAKYLIFEYSNNKNMRLVCSDFYKYLDDIKESFLKQLDDERLFITYQLERYDRYIYNNYYREKKYLENPKKIIINRNNFDNNIGYIYDMKVKFDKKFIQNLIPCSEFEESTRNNLDGKVIYWELNNININNLLIFKKFLLLK